MQSHTLRLCRRTNTDIRLSRNKIEPKFIIRWNVLGWMYHIYLTFHIILHIHAYKNLWKHTPVINNHINSNWINEWNREGESLLFFYVYKNNMVIIYLSVFISRCWQINLLLLLPNEYIIPTVHLRKRLHHKYFLHFLLFPRLFLFAMFILTPTTTCM